jgi:hypothetical protein
MADVIEDNRHLLERHVQRDLPTAELAEILLEVNDHNDQ